MNYPFLTKYERDTETALDFAQARYYASGQGRFTSVDPVATSAKPASPQTFNRYSYVSNSPLNSIDPTGTFGIRIEENEQLPGKPDQQQPTPPPSAQPTPTAPAPDAQVPTNVTAKVGDPKPYGNLPLGPNNYFSGMGSIIEFTVTDANETPILNVAVTEAVTPASSVQNSVMVTRNDGKILDLVGQGSFGPQLTNGEARAAARDARNTPRDRAGSRNGDAVTEWQSSDRHSPTNTQ